MKQNMNETNEIKFLSHTILGLKSALLDASNEIQQLRDSCLSLYVKFAKEQVKSIELGTACNKIKTKFEKELKDSQLELSELRKELTVKENDNINLNFKVKQLKAHVEEKTKLIESFYIKEKGEKQHNQHTCEDLIEAIKTVLKNGFERKDTKFLKELKKYLHEISLSVNNRWMQLNNNSKHVNSEKSCKSFTNKLQDSATANGAVEGSQLNSVSAENDIPELSILNQTLVTAMKNNITESDVVPEIQNCVEFEQYSDKFGEVTNKDIFVKPEKYNNSISYNISVKNDETTAESKEFHQMPKSLTPVIEYFDNHVSNNISLHVNDINESCERNVGESLQYGCFNNEVTVDATFSVDDEVIELNQLSEKEVSLQFQKCNPNDQSADNTSVHNADVVKETLEISKHTNQECIKANSSENLVNDIKLISTDNVDKLYETSKEQNSVKQICEDSNSVKNLFDEPVWSLLKEIDHLRTLTSKIEDFRKFCEEDSFLEQTQSDQVISKCSVNNVEFNEINNPEGAMPVLSNCSKIKTFEQLSDIDLTSAMDKKRSRSHSSNNVKIKRCKSVKENNIVANLEKPNEEKERSRIIDDEIIEINRNIDKSHDSKLPLKNENVVDNAASNIEKFNENNFKNSCENKPFVEGESNPENNEIFKFFEEIDNLRKKMLEGQKEFTEFLQEENCPFSQQDIKNENLSIISEIKYDAICEFKNEIEFIILAEILSDDRSENIQIKEEEKSLINFDSFYIQNQLVADSLHNMELKTMEIESADLYDSFDNVNQQDFFKDTDILPDTNETEDDRDDENDNLIIVEEDENAEIDETNKEGVISCNFHTVKNANNLSPNINCHQIADHHVLNICDRTESETETAAIKSKNSVNDEEKNNPHRYNLRCHKGRQNSVNYCYNQHFSTNRAGDSNYRSLSSESDEPENLMQNDCHEIMKKQENETVERINVKRLLPKFYVENHVAENKPKLLTYLSPLDEIWSVMKKIHFDKSNFYLSLASELIPCCKSVVLVAFYYKKVNTELKSTEIPGKKIVFEKIEQILKTFIEERSQNIVSAFSTCISCISTSNMKTVSCAMVEIIISSVSDDVKIQNMIIYELVRLSFEIEKIICKGFVDILKTTVKSKIHSETWNINKNLNGSVISCVILLSKFYTIFCKMMSDPDSIVNFVHQSLLSLKYKAHPIAFSVMTEWPQVFSFSSYESSLLIQIMLFCLVNHKMKYNAALYKTSEVQKLISTFYQIKLGVNNAEEYAKIVMTRLDDKTWVDAIVLLCKRQVFPWAYTNLIMKYIIPIFNKWKTEYFDEIILIKCLLALKEIMAFCPIREDQNEIYNIDLIVRRVSEILSKEKGNRELKETAALVLCELSSLRFSACADILFSWCPADGLISLNVVEKLHFHMTKRKHINNWFWYIAPEKYALRSKKTKKSQIYAKRIFQTKKNNDQIKLGINQTSRNSQGIKKTNKTKTNKKKTKRKKG